MKGKAILSIIISIILSISFFENDISSVRVLAASNPYPATQDVDGDGYYEVPCTRFAWQQVYDNLGVAITCVGECSKLVASSKECRI